MLQVDKPALVPIFCRKCGRHLADAVMGAAARCPKCKVWQKAESGAQHPHGPLGKEG